MGDGMSSKRPVVPEGLDRSTNQLAVRKDDQNPSERGTRPSFVLGIVWCAIGSAFLPLASVFANVLIAFGMTIALAGTKRYEQTVVLPVALVAATVAALTLFGVYAIPTTVISVLGAYALAWATVSGRLRTGVFLLVAIAIGCAGACSDAVMTSMQGTSVPELMAQAVDEVVESSMASLDLEGTAAILEARDTVLAYWPTMYFVVGLANALCALLGTWMGSKASRLPVQEGMIVRYDVPLWVGVVFACGVAVELLGPRLPLWQEGSAMVGANMVMCARIALAQQGLSVLQWRMRGRSVVHPARILAVIAALWLEMSFALASVVGLLDVAVNFRHLKRGRPDILPRPRQEQ